MRERAVRDQRASEVRAALEAVQGAVLQSRHPSEETRGPRTLVLRGIEHLSVKNGDLLLLVGTNKGAFFYARPAPWRLSRLLRSLIDRAFGGSLSDTGSHITIIPFNRHRGGANTPTPAKPPCVRVRTRRFKWFALASIDQRGKSERSEVSIGSSAERALARA